MTKNSIAVGVDVGYGILKSASKNRNGNTISFKTTSIVGRKEVLNFRPNIDLLERFEVAFGNEQFYTGPLAEIQSGLRYDTMHRSWIKSPYYRALFYVGLGNSIISALKSSDSDDRAEYELNVKVGTGLPVEYFSDDHESLGKDLSGYHEFTLGNSKHGKMRTFKLTLDTIVIPQPFGTYYHEAIDENGELRDERFAKTHVAVIDAGNNTTDISVLHNADYVPKDSHSIEIGGHKVISAVVARINRKYKTNLKKDDYEIIRHIMIKKECQVKSETIDVSDIVEECSYEVGAKILSFLKEQLEQASNISCIVVTGGASNVFFKYILEEYPHAVQVDGDPSLANVSGFLNIASEIMTSENAAGATEAIEEEVEEKFEPEEDLSPGL